MHHIEYLILIHINFRIYSSYLSLFYFSTREPLIFTFIQVIYQ